MPLSRFLAIALLLFPPTAFSQSMLTDAPSGARQTAEVARNSEPWRIFPAGGLKPALPRDSLSQHQVQQAQILKEEYDPDAAMLDAPAPDSVTILPKSRVFTEYACYAIRSYVVARDSKDSDSTHMVHYSTCQPASKYQVKSIELQARPQNR